MKILRKIAGVGVLLAAPTLIHAQGILTVTPGRTVTTTAGTGAVGYSGDGGAATSATLARPSAVAYDSKGNLYIADADNNVIREVAQATGVITTVTGTGVEGFSGDGGAATSAQLDAPTGIAVDANGDIFIADSRNQRIREVSSGTIKTIAGNGTAGYAGDGAAATAAELDLPSAVAVDANGNLYIADTNNDRIRKISGGTISTIAGTGEQSYTGDSGAATSATLDSPTGVAVDSAGNVYIADRHNQRVREISATGTITTLAGSGTPSFGGGYGGDGSSATAAALANPTGVSVDASGNVYIADTNNHRIRQIGGGAIKTVAGNGEQGFGGDGGAATDAVLDTPQAAAPDASGNLALADALNQRIRAGVLPSLIFTAQAVGTPSAAQTITLSNTGSASLTVSSAALSGPFSIAKGGSCPAAPITLAPGASCTEAVSYMPADFGAATGSITFSGTGVPPSKVLLTGTGSQGTATVTLTSSNPTLFTNQPVTFTATVAPSAGNTVPTGTVTFYAGSTVIGTAQTLNNGSASVTTTFVSAGTYAITAVYSGDTNFAGLTSAVLTQSVGALDFTITPGPGGSVSQTVEPGQAATFNFTVAPLNGTFTLPITLSATGLPPGATATFTPQSLTPGSSSVQFSMKIQTVANSAMLNRLNGVSGATMAVVLLFVPFARRRKRSMPPLLLVLLGVGSLFAMGAITGCGSNSGFFGQQQHAYTIQVTGTATGLNGATLQHSTSVTLTVQ